MKIVHVARSSVAGVPVTLSRCLNQVSGVESTSIDINDYMYQRHGLGFKLNGADIIHWHNFIDVDLYNVTKHLKHVMHYHSDPGNDQIERVIATTIDKMLIVIPKKCRRRTMVFMILSFYCEGQPPQKMRTDEG